MELKILNNTAEPKKVSWKMDRNKEVIKELQFVSKLTPGAW